MYYFNGKNYDYAIGDFTELLKRQPDHVSSRLHRGLSHFYLEDFQAALLDFSATLHYDPGNWSAYYHRACLLRSCNPSQALKDFSISLLINPEYENLGSYLHRALIYCHQEQFDEAIADYEAILVLDREHAPALCNLAIIFMKRNVQKALDLFTRSIEAEPTYVRAYFCRAYFYTQIGQLQQAYSDYTKSKANRILSSSSSSSSPRSLSHVSRSECGDGSAWQHVVGDGSIGSRLVLRRSRSEIANVGE